MENNNNISIEKIRAVLQKINYPGFSRDIVSFGMVKHISIKGNIIDISLQINSENEKILNQLQDEIQTTLKAQGVSEAIIHFQKPENKSVQLGVDKSSLNQQPIPGVKNVLAIASGKGGVGKSTVAINLAASLSKTNKVGLLDLDIYGPSLPMMVGIDKQPKMTSEKKLLPINKFNMSFMSFGFLNADNAPTIWRGPMVSRMTQQFFDDVVWGELDFLILDLPPGTGDIQLTLVQKLALTGAIIVTTPQKLALLDVHKGAEMFEKVNTPILGIIENMTHFLCPHCDETSEIFPGSGGEEESKRLGVPLLGKIYLNPDIAQSTDCGTPFVLKYEDSPITSEFSKIVSQINEISGSSILETV